MRGTGHEADGQGGAGSSGSSRSPLRAFVAALVRERPGRLSLVIFVQAATGLSQAAGVLLLIPLLGAVGVGSKTPIARWTHRVFVDFGLRPTLATVIVTYVVVAAANAGMSAYQGVLSMRYRLEFVDHLRTRLYRAVAVAEWRHTMQLRQADVVAVLTGNINMVGLGAQGALGVVVIAILLAAQLWATIRISPAMTGLATASGIVLVLVVWPLVHRSRRLGAELIQRNRSLMRLVKSFVDSLKLAKAYGREREHEAAFANGLAQVRESQLAFARASGIASAVQGTLSAALLGLAVYVAVRIAQVPVGSLLVVTFVFTRIVGQIVASQASIQQVAQALPAYEEAMELICSCEAAQEAPNTHVLDRPAIGIGRGITLEDVWFAYPGRRGERAEALRGVSLEIQPGSTVALAGASGAGKTTVADLVAGLMLPTAGRVTVDRELLTRQRLLGWRRSVALVPQDPYLFDDTIEANLRWARDDAHDAELSEALRLANAYDFVHELPDGLQTVVGNRGLRLSGGERQRLALARALLRDPELLILDEATSSLDTENELAIRTALSSLRGRVTILLIAHRLSTVSDADQILVLDAGRVVEAGSWHALASLPAGRLQSLIEAGAIASAVV